MLCYWYGWIFSPMDVCCVAILTTLNQLTCSDCSVIVAEIKRWLTDSLSDWLTDWQGHLLSCPGQLKMYHGGSFLKLADDNKYIKNPEAQNRALRGFWENAFFVFLHYRGIGVFWPKIPLNLTSEGLKYPQEVRVQHETCSTICGTPVQAILDQKNLTGLAGGVKEGQNMAHR